MLDIIIRMRTVLLMRTILKHIAIVWNYNWTFFYLSFLKFLSSSSFIFSRVSPVQVRKTQEEPWTHSLLKANDTPSLSHNPLGYATYIQEGKATLDSFHSWGVGSRWRWPTGHREGTLLRHQRLSRGWEGLEALCWAQEKIVCGSTQCKAKERNEFSCPRQQSCKGEWVASRKVKEFRRVRAGQAV